MDHFNLHLSFKLSIFIILTCTVSIVSDSLGERHEGVKSTMVRRTSDLKL